MNKDRLQLVIPETVKTWLKGYSSDSGLSMSAIIIIALQEFKRREEQQQFELYKMMRNGE